MKTNEVKACVTQQLRRLQVLPEPQRRAELAELRRGVGRQPGDLPALWGALLADMPEQLQGSNGPSKAEWAVYTALTLFALHQQGEADVSMNQPGRTLGGAVRQLAEKTAAGQDWTESSVLRRFNALATADSMPSCAAVSGMLWWSIILFPAYAGVIPAKTRHPRLWWTFPRIRGGDPPEDREISGRVIFSPHTRG